MSKKVRKKTDTSLNIYYTHLFPLIFPFQLFVYFFCFVLLLLFLTFLSFFFCFELFCFISFFLFAISVFLSIFSFWFDFVHSFFLRFLVHQTIKNPSFTQLNLLIPYLAFLLIDSSRISSSFLSLLFFQMFLLF